MITTVEPKLVDHAIRAMRRIGRPVTAGELLFLGALRVSAARIAEALEGERERGLVTREERVEPFAHGSRVQVTRVYYALVGGEVARG